MRRYKCSGCGGMFMFLLEGERCSSCYTPNIDEKHPCTDVKEPNAPKMTIGSGEKVKRRESVIREVVSGGVEGAYISGVQRKLEEAGIHVSFSTVKRDLRRMGLGAESVRGRYETQN